MNVTKICNHVTYHDNILVRIQWSLTSERKRFGTSGVSSVTDVAKMPLTAGFAPSCLIHTTDVYAENTAQRRRDTEPTGPNGTASSLHFRKSAEKPTSQVLRSPSCQTTGQYLWTEQIIISFTHYFQLINPSETRRNMLTHWGRGHLNCLNARSRVFF